MPVLSPQNTLDTAFDAGGRVSVGLTATTIVSQWTWAATLLYSCTVASKVRHQGSRLGRSRNWGTRHRIKSQFVNFEKHF